MKSGQIKVADFGLAKDKISSTIRKSNNPFMVTLRVEGMRTIARRQGLWIICGLFVVSLHSY